MVIRYFNPNSSTDYDHVHTETTKTVTEGMARIAELEWAGYVILD